MTESIKEVQRENQLLRDLVVSLSATLLRTVAVHASKERGQASRDDAQRFIAEAEDCFRCARIPGLKEEIAQGLEVAGHELMKKAVEVETALQRTRKNT